MNTAVDDLVHPMEVMSICPEMFGEQQQRRLTLEERREIAKARFRKAKQERKRIHNEFVAKLYPHAVLRPECLRTQSNPDPPTLWYGFPINPSTYRDYLAKKGNPDGLDLDCDPHFVITPALKILWEVCKTTRICDINPVCPYSDDLPRMIGFKCSLWPSAHHPITKADERMAARLREELGLPEDRPCLWHFANLTADKAVALYESYSYVPLEFVEVTWDDLVDSEISNLELSNLDLNLDSDDESEL